MTAGVFDLFKLGVGPSSSHTMGPMTAAARFAARLRSKRLLARTARVEIKLYASLALTGKGHHTDRAVILGLMGQEPAGLDPDAGEAALKQVASERRLRLGGDHIIGFDAERDVVWARGERLPQHPNALTFTAFGAAGEPLLSRTFFSIGGGFVRDEDEIGRNAPGDDEGEVPYPFESGETLLAKAAAADLTIAGLMLQNELAGRGADQVEAGLD
ncbi:MAG: L-serine ammonia-lyase, partial [Caulobacteraceae bacterium]|nr:L-serine ammonia-lyase [Caulobacteraceae bacterium]